MFEMRANQSDRHERSELDQSFQIWIDGVGGYLVCPQKVVWVGQAVPQAGIDIPIVGDLRRRHARIELHQGEHLIAPVGELKLNGTQAHDGISPLIDGHELELGNRVKLKYQQPHPLSQTGRLEFHSGNRTAPWSDAVLLMAQSIIIGPSNRNHIPSLGWDRTVILFRRDESLWCRAGGEFEVDGRAQKDEAKVTLSSSICGEDFSLALEPASKLYRDKETD